jgi:hypothetical protein
MIWKLYDQKQLIIRICSNQVEGKYLAILNRERGPHD